MLKNILLFIVLLALLVLPENIFASRHQALFWEALSDADLVVIGDVQKPIIKSKFGRDIGIYEIKSPEVIKGNKPEGSLYVVDFHMFSTGSLSLSQNKKFLLFLIESGNDELKIYGIKEYYYNNMKTYTSIRECLYNSENKKEIREALKGTEFYFSLTDKSEKKKFILENLEKNNRYLNEVIHREAMLLHVKEAVPYFKKFLKSPDEYKKLNAASTIRCIQHPEIAPFLGDLLVSWLKDPAFKKKNQTINEIERLGYKEAIPILREFADGEDEIAAVSAMSALLRFGEPDAKSLLFAMVINGKSDTPRSNAMFHLHEWSNKNDFNEEEIKLIKEFLKDKDEFVRRQAGYILDNIE